MANTTNAELMKLSITELERKAREEGNIEYLISFIMDMHLSDKDVKNALCYSITGEEDELD